MGLLVEDLRNAGPNLLEDEDLSDRYDNAVWTQRMEKLSKVGATCSKVARNSKCYKRTFWLRNGCLKTNGRKSADMSLAELTGIYKGNGSAEFANLKTQSKRPSLLWKRKSSSAPEPNLCCVLAMKDRSFSLYFGSTKERDEFVETLTWYVQQRETVGQTGYDDVPEDCSDDEEEDSDEEESDGLQQIDGLQQHGGRQGA